MPRTLRTCSPPRWSRRRSWCCSPWRWRPSSGCCSAGSGPARYPRARRLLRPRKWFVDQLMELSLDVDRHAVRHHLPEPVVPPARREGRPAGRGFDGVGDPARPAPPRRRELRRRRRVGRRGAGEGDARHRSAPVRVGRRGVRRQRGAPPAGRRTRRRRPDRLPVGPAGRRPRRPGTAWVGSPAFHLPQRQESTAFPAEHNSPSRRGGCGCPRAAIEFFRVTLPATGLVVPDQPAHRRRAGAAVGDIDRPGVLALFPLLYAGGGVAGRALRGGR